MLTRFHPHKQLFFGACFLLLPVFLFSQDKIIDSLENKLKLATHDSSRWDILFYLSKGYYGYDTAKSGVYLARVIP